MLNDNAEIKLTDKSSGLGDGITGMISALLHIYELTALSEFREGAIRLINRLSVSEQSYNTDYLNGIGALPVILKRHHIPESDKISSGFYKEILNTKPFTTGFAHGASGLVLSLSDLSSLGLPVSADAITALLSWENSYFTTENGNWQDLRNSPEIGYMSGWCSGAPGIGMARKEMLGSITDENLRLLCEKDINLSEEFIIRETPSKRDSLCCGTASKLMAASRLEIRIDKTFELLFTAEKENRLRFIHPADTADVNVSLMQGLSGFAYALAMYGDPLSGGMLL
jgi:lantibiotic modifying enzyme